MNIASLLTKNAQLFPDKDAVIAPDKTFWRRSKYQSLSFKELETRSNDMAKGLLKKGVIKGDKVLVFVKPGLDFPAITFSLFKIGAVPVFIDPGMGRVNLLKAISSTRPKVLLAVPIVFLIKLFFRKAFSSITISISTLGFNRLAKQGAQSSIIIEDNIKEIELAAILFTSGGTGIPKGVEYTHKIFSSQTKVLQELFSLTPEDRDMPGFPLFALFTIAMGMTSCIPDMNPSKPGNSDPKKLYQNIIDQSPTFVAGSPAIWEKLADYCILHRLQLPSIKYLVMFGAPISLSLHERFESILTSGTTYTPYGATESLPVSCISGHEILNNFSESYKTGKGVCIGKAVPMMDIRVIKLGKENQEINHIDETEQCEQDEMGEIIVSAQTVTRKYFNMPDKTKLSKIKDKNDKFWHRIGDTGYFDKDMNLWFTGRCSYTVITKNSVLSSIQCEAIFNQHPSIKRSALIKKTVASQQEYFEPQIVLELLDGSIPTGDLKKEITQELNNLGQRFAHTQTINKFYFIKSMPVDIRHNIKIDRNALSAMVNQEQLS